MLFVQDAFTAGAAVLSERQEPPKLSKSSTADLSPQQLGQWQTATRLLASLCNDFMIKSKSQARSSNDHQAGLLLYGKDAKSPSTPVVWVGLSAIGYQRLAAFESVSKRPAVFPGDFTPPILLSTWDGAEHNAVLEYAPAKIFNHLRMDLGIEPVDDALWNDICAELTSSAENGRYWIEWYQTQKPLSLKSSMIQWEQALYSGHPMHPVSGRSLDDIYPSVLAGTNEVQVLKYPPPQMHRAFSVREPMPKISPENISSLTSHSISLISVPGSDIRISGPLRKVLRPLLAQFGLDNLNPGKVIIPCITMQIPVIKHYHPATQVLIEDAFKGQAQSSLRTITLPYFEYDLKFALDVTIGSALRTISSRTVCILSELSTVLREILPENHWLMADVAGIAGSQPDFDSSKHISCVFRENLNKKALENNETLVVAGALQETPPGSDECNAALVFKLHTEEEKMDWFTTYTEGIIEAYIGPVVDYGIAFEAHAQNVLIRMDRSTGKIKGWASRDLGSVKVHLPTLARSGYEIFSIVEGTLVPTQSEIETWRIIQFCLIENHLNIFIYRLGIPRPVAWKMIREKLVLFFEGRKYLENAQGLKDFLFAEEIQLKAFMMMKFAKKARVYDYVFVPNVLLEGIEQSERNEVNEISDTNRIAD